MTRKSSPQPGLFGPLGKEPSSRTIAAESARLVRVAVENGADQLFDYAVPNEFTDKLSPGQRVRVKAGALAGLEGTVIARRNTYRLLVAVNFLQQGVSVAIDDFMVEPID